jgi:23S rRNA (adenine2503-C2)-methyltransferase
MKIFAQTYKEFSAELFSRTGKGAADAAQLYRNAFLKGDLSEGATAELALPGPIRIAQDQEALKFSTTLSDGNAIESVVIPAAKRTTLCVSSQAGCRFGCRFCATGGRGFTRDLTTHEIVGQVFIARFILQRTINNIVFMGMGEPLDNFDNVAQAIRVISDQRGLNIPPCNITLSTAGHADGIARLAALNMPTLCLAVSLHAADETVRSRLMPINRQFPLALLKKRLKEYPLGKRGVFFIEYIVIPGINDSREMAKKLVGFLEGLPVRLNLLAFNPHPSLPYRAPTDDRMKQFRQWLVEKGLFVRIRKSRGAGISAACGQLAPACR